MARSLTPEGVLALAPDASSSSSARKLAAAGHWPTLARSAQWEGVLWGECRGSGSQPYLVGVDLRLEDVASKCSCPSRKFPCKHALALLLLGEAQPQAFTEAAVPDTLVKWLEGRQTRAEKPSQPRPEKPVDLAAQAKRQAARDTKVTRGLEDLHLWLCDLIREGLMAARTRSSRDWDSMAARMVDAQAPGAARLVRQIPDHLHDEGGTALLAHLGKLALLCEGWLRRDTLTDPERQQVLLALGQPVEVAAVLAGPGETGRWQVMGHTTESEGKLLVRRTWLRRQEDGLTALLLDFAPQGQGLPVPLPQAMAEVALHFVPSAHPQRAVLPAGAAACFAEVSEALANEGTAQREAAGAVLAGCSVAGLYAEYARALALNPWLERIGMELGPVQLLPEPPEAHDMEGHAVPLTVQTDTGGVYAHLAASEGHLVMLYGEWDGRQFVPLSLRPVWPAGAGHD